MCISVNQRTLKAQAEEQQWRDSQGNLGLYKGSAQASPVPCTLSYLFLSTLQQLRKPIISFQVWCISGFEPVWQLPLLLKSKLMLDLALFETHLEAAK